MFVMLFLGFILFFIIFMVLIIILLLSKKDFFDREKGSVFECGFDPVGSARLPFSLRFFLIAVIFLIFDVEVTLLLPMCLIVDVVNYTSYFMVGAVFIFILLGGLYYEWDGGAFDWAS
uniref:NADH-ubiquinone oxidoreductase chain 3 n=1 Tax=Hutchinsoniella macracantha TaxID=84335 RepID=Q6SKZ9_9CRUS|nr:NADH dehydrogenase subunit 3 [Hutchinsoniella macracantha]